MELVLPRLILAPVSPPSLPDLVLVLLPLLSCERGRVSVLARSPAAVVSTWPRAWAVPSKRHRGLGNAGELFSESQPPRP